MPSPRGLLLPFISEYTWPEEVRATLYFVALLYCFMGVAIIADIFMGSIEKITSKTRKVSRGDWGGWRGVVIDGVIWDARVGVIGDDWQEPSPKSKAMGGQSTGA